MYGVPVQYAPVVQPVVRPAVQYVAVAGGMPAGMAGGYGGGGYGGGGYGEGRYGGGGYGGGGYGGGGGGYGGGRGRRPRRQKGSACNTLLSGVAAGLVSAGTQAFLQSAMDKKRRRAKAAKRRTTSADDEPIEELTPEEEAAVAELEAADPEAAAQAEAAIEEDATAEAEEEDDIEESPGVEESFGDAAADIEVGAEEEAAAEEEVDAEAEVAMYGAAPQDLPDPGAPPPPCAPGVLSGKFNRPLNLKTKFTAKLQAELLKEIQRRYETHSSLAFPTPAGIIYRPVVLQSKMQTLNETITIVTQCSIDRLPRLQAMAESWDGAISLAVHVPRDIDVASLMPALTRLHKHVEAMGKCRLDMVLRQEPRCVEKTWADELYPINALRNAALDHVKTAKVLLLDVDFAVSAGAHARLACHFARVSSAAAAHGRKACLVVPAFELNFEHQTDEASILESKEALRSSYVNGDTTGFHIGHFPKGHRATNYGRFFFDDAQTDNASYEVDYESCFEPYIVCNKFDVPRYDERFRGYGLNKVSHLMACSKLARLQFVAVRDCYVLSPEMQKSTAWAKMYDKRLKDPLLALKIQVLFNRFKRDLKDLEGEAMDSDKAKQQQQQQQHLGLALQQEPLLQLVRG